MDPASEKVDASGNDVPPPTQGQKLAGGILRVFGYLAMFVGGFCWVVTVLASVFLFRQSGVEVFLNLALAILISVSFLVTGRGAYLAGEVYTGKAPPVAAPLLLKKLVRDLIFEVTGLLFLPLFLAGVSLLIGGEPFGWSFLAVALAIGFGLPRVLKVAVRAMEGRYSEP